ncbi:profilin Pfy1 [Aspergillus luchuensis]|uniref:Profilin n=1 Tax=Aspergillus kawachii TaxID=1069201 RepID=A0A146FGF6_ASPKA|nr:profilin Pfy1 [Aspergillus luchuensis]
MGQHSAIWQATISPALRLALPASRYDTLPDHRWFDRRDPTANQAPNQHEPSASPQELQGIAAAFKDPNSAFGTGITIGGEKFVTIRADERSLYGKKGKEGIVVVKAVSCVMVAHHAENAQTTNAATVVENLVDYINNPR